MTIDRHRVVYWFGALWKKWNIALKHSKYLQIVVIQFTLYMYRVKQRVCWFCFE